jgi:hypothetical protein
MASSTELVDPEVILREGLSDYDVLECFAEEWSKCMAGEEKLAKLLYLICTSRLLRKPMHAVIKGPSSAGKSEIRKQVLKFFPPEDIISFTAMSDKALIHHRADFQHAILSMAEADGSKERAFQDYLLRELMSEGKIRYDVVTPIKGVGTTTVTVEKEGPVCFLVTTTKNRLHQRTKLAC